MIGYVSSLLLVTRTAYGRLMTTTDASSTQSPTNQQATQRPLTVSLALPAHPLEPLGPDEIAATAAVLAGSGVLPEGSRYVFVELHEPAKDVLAAWTPGAAWDRETAVVLR